MSSEATLILTLKLDKATFDCLNALRERHFPRARNLIPAHITLFHALPGQWEARVRNKLQEFCAETQRVRVSFPKLRFLGRGIAVEIDSPELVRLRGSLAQEWRDWLGTQDKQGYRPHVTIQNKVAVVAARLLYEDLAHCWEPFAGFGEGLLLWQYLGGPWKLLDEFNFVQSET